MINISWTQKFEEKKNAKCRKSQCTQAVQANYITTQVRSKAQRTLTKPSQITVISDKTISG